MIKLTQEDRDRFATWLEEEAATDDKLAEQAEKLAAPAFVKMKRAEALAARVVARKLRSIHEF